MSETYGFYHKENFPLEIFMDEEVDSLIRVWDVKGLQIKGVEINKGERCEATIVGKRPNEPYVLSLRIRKDGTIYVKRIGEFQTLDKLKEKYPFLFLINGNFCAILNF